MTTQADYCIRIDQVDFSYGHQQVLHHNTLDIPSGSVYGLLGPSGCGKTTLVKLMAGILKAQHGTITVLGQAMPNLRHMHQIGYMAQSDALYELLSARENMIFFGSIYGLRRQQLQQRIKETAALVDLTAELDMPVQHYSGGMKRRLSLAIALLHAPPLLILDEPTVGIDPLLRRNIWQQLFALADTGVSIVVTTHIMDEAERCHQLAMMRSGVLLTHGSQKEILTQSGADNLEAAFLFYGGDTDACAGHDLANS